MTGEKRNPYREGTTAYQMWELEQAWQVLAAALAAPVERMAARLKGDR